jgi:hypothetical protein
VKNNNGASGVLINPNIENRIKDEAMMKNSITFFLSGAFF